MAIKTLIEEIAGAIKITVNNKKWNIIEVPYSIKTFSYKDGVGILTGINNEYKITIKAEKMFTIEECKKYPWKICAHRVWVDIDEFNIIDIVVNSGNQYPLIADYISQFIFGKMWSLYASNYTDEMKLNWF